MGEGKHMFDNLIDNMKFYTATIFSIVIWGAAIALFVYYHMSRHSFLNDFLSPAVVNTVTAALAYIGLLPLLNYAADKEQFGSVVGAARQMSMFSERPWYGEGSYQFLIFLVIILSGFIIAWVNRRRY
uniref:Uncharacterized protein n=2 Tax=Enterobacterales TaxID=91347 RepID=L7Z9S1_CITFR|nr:hypothetical protein [Citrobacter freundii]